jgi:Mg2+ and Co2+ transporter CorA
VKLKIPLFRRKYIISFFTIFFFLSTVLCGYASDVKRFFRCKPQIERKICESFIKDNSKNITKKQKKEIRKGFKNLVHTSSIFGKTVEKIYNARLELAKANKKIKEIEEKIKKLEKSSWSARADSLEATDVYEHNIYIVEKNNNIAVSRFRKEFLNPYRREYIKAVREGNTKIITEILMKDPEIQQKVLEKGV